MQRSDKTERLDRHSATGSRGLSKKEGHAGKGGWGKVGTGEDGESIIDRNDPNYVSDEDEKSVVLKKVEFVNPPSEVLIQEYLSSGDISEIARTLAELEIPHLHSHFVKKAVIIAMEKSAYERELISLLLASEHVYGKVLTRTQVEEGFQSALDALDDACLDIPDATDILSKFLARAIVDEIVPPIFLSTAIVQSTRATEVLKLATALSSENHGGERLAHIWGPGDLKSVKRLKQEVALILNEYLTAEDATEAEKCVRKLNAPSFLFQIVQQALRLVMERNDQNTKKKITTLLSNWAHSDFIVSDQIQKGFACTYLNLNDIKLDIPHAETLLAELKEIATNDGWLDKNFVPPKPRPTLGISDSSPVVSTSS